jgi:hypothetical protein
MMGSRPAVNRACWGAVNPILLNLTMPSSLASILLNDSLSTGDLREELRLRSNRLFLQLWPSFD